jgi:inosine-uridine nucleoside N-ribohydrolase
MSSSWLTDLPKNAKLWFDTDIGNDIDDVLALLLCMQVYGRENFVGVSTTFYKPDQKARIARTILNAYSFQQVPVYAGIGIYDPETEGESLIKSIYKTWPAKFGYPWSPGSVSAKEAAAYKTEYKTEFDSLKFEKNTAVAALKEAAIKYKSDLVIVSAGFPTNVAAALGTLIENKVNRIVIMGGWFEDETGGIKRLGYNTVIDLAASKKILEQKNIPVIIVSSEFCKSYAINKREYDSFQDATHKPGSRKIGKAICEDMKVWMEGKKQEDSENMIHIGDPIAAYLAFKPEEIQEGIPVEVEIKDYVEGVDMFHADAKQYATVKKVASSNVVVVKSVKNPEKLRSEIVQFVTNAFGWKKF